MNMPSVVAEEDDTKYLLRLTPFGWQESHYTGGGLYKLEVALQIT